MSIGEHSETYYNNENMAANVFEGNMHKYEYVSRCGSLFDTNMCWISVGIV